MTHDLRISAELMAKAKKIVDETCDIEVVGRENIALFKQLEETRKTAESNLNVVLDSDAEAQKILESKLLALQR